MLTREEAAALLGVAPDAPEADVKRAWRALALLSHPDKNPGDESASQRFRDANQAFKTLLRQDADVRSYEQMAADMEDARTALIAAMSRASVARDQPGGVTASHHKVMELGPRILWVGEVDTGRPHGEGDLILANGSVHHGRFDAGRASGAGVFFDASGMVTEGSWIDNKRVGPFSTVDPKGQPWRDTYDADGKRTSRKKGDAGPTMLARKCRHCSVK